jgi:uncharacterized C2H2 Zn-finger protein
MPIWLEEQTVEVIYECPRCGTEGVADADATSLCDGAIIVYEIECPKCGLTLQNQEDDWEEEEEEEDY